VVVGGVAQPVVSLTIVEELAWSASLCQVLAAQHPRSQEGSHRGALVHYMTDTTGGYL